MQVDIERMRNMLKLQGEDGYWNFDPYMHGLYNGMEYMLAMAEGREPEYREAPETWQADYITQSKPTQYKGEDHG